MSENVKQVYDANPSTTFGNNDLFYLGKSPYGPTDDSAILGSNLKAQIAPLTTKGDLYTFSTVNIRFALGTAGQVLQVNTGTATGLEWTSTLSNTVQDNITRVGTIVSGVWNAGTVTATTASRTAFSGKTSGDHPVGIEFFNSLGASSGYIGIEDSAGAGYLGTPGAYSVSISSQINGTGQLGFGTQQVIAGIIDTSQRWLLGYTSNQTGSKLQVNGSISTSTVFNGAQGADIASAGTINLETATGNVVDVTGTTTITAVTLSQGHERLVRFAGALTLTNGASLVLPSGANITTAAGDYAKFAGYAAGVVRVTEYTRASGKPVVISNTPWTIVPGASTTMVSNNNYVSTDEVSSTFALPVTVTAGDSLFVAFADDNDAHFISQQAGQTINLAGYTTTAGVGHGITNSFTSSLVLLVATSSTNFNAYPLNGSWQTY